MSELREPPYQKWKPRALCRCDSCATPVVWLYQVPDGTPDGEEDSLCWRCAMESAYGRKWRDR